MVCVGCSWLPGCVLCFQLRCSLQCHWMTVFGESRGHEPHRCAANLRTFVFIPVQLVSGFNDSSSIQSLKGAYITACSRSPPLTESEFCVIKCDKTNDCGTTLSKTQFVNKIKDRCHGSVFKRCNPSRFSDLPVSFTLVPTCGFLPWGIQCPKLKNQMYILSYCTRVILYHPFCNWLLKCTDLIFNFFCLFQHTNTEFKTKQPQCDPRCNLI